MSGASGGSTHAPTRCLYVALNVPRDASSSDIKKAYRREALVWHPDKNVGNEGEAQVRFQELQHAYAVLSDAYERKWYDDHRDEILNPRSGGTGDDSDDEEGRGRTVNLNTYFSASAFNGFGDDESGFYQTYSRAFQQVWEAEREWGDFDSANASSDDAAGATSRAMNRGVVWGKGEAPEMGRGNDPHDVPDAFYSSWSGFLSGLSFGWVDEYNVNEAGNRRVRRLMEKENSKRRAVARRKYQDDVRALVEFCRRRDKRVIKHKLKLAKEKEARERRQAEEQIRKKEDMKRRKEEWSRAKQAEEKVEEEERARQGVSAAFRLGESGDDDDDDSDRGHEAKKSKKKRGKGKGVGGGAKKVVVFRCVVCKKDFKSAGQMSNHETSKAHKKKLQELDRDMLREARASGKRQGQEESEDFSELGDDTNQSDEGNSSSDQSQNEDEEEEADFFMDNAMREELGLGSGLGLDDKESAMSRSNGTSHGQEIAHGDGRGNSIAIGNLECDVEDIESCSTDCGVPGVWHMKREEGQGEHGIVRGKGTPKGKGECEESGHSGQRGNDVAKGGFDVFNSSSSNEGTSSDESESGDESGHGGTSGSEGETDDKVHETVVAMAKSSAAAALMVDALDPEGMTKGKMEADATAIGATVAKFAKHKFNLDEQLTRSAMTWAASTALDWFKEHAAVPKTNENLVERSSGSEWSNVDEPSRAQQEHSRKNRNRVSRESRNSNDCTSESHTDPQAADCDSESEKGEESGKGNASASEAERLRPVGRRGRRKVGAKGEEAQQKHTAASSDQNTDKGARRRKRQALKAVMAALQGKGGRQGKAGGDKAKGGGEDDGGDVRRACCRVCGKKFPSRSRLFAHVKNEGHAMATL